MFSTLSFWAGFCTAYSGMGMMVSDGVDYFHKFWVAGFPGLAIFRMAVRGELYRRLDSEILLDPKLRTAVLIFFSPGDSGKISPANSHFGGVEGGGARFAVTYFASRVARIQINSIKQIYFYEIPQTGNFLCIWDLYFSRINPYYNFLR